MAGEKTRKHYNAPDCPRCGRQMNHRGTKSESGRDRWICAKRDCDFGSTTASKDAYNSIEPGWDQARIDANVERIRGQVAKGRKTFVIAGAQDNTQKSYAAWASLNKLCEHRAAQLILLPIRYRNITAASNTYRAWWALGLEDSLVDDCIYLGAGVEARGDIRLSPTTINPLAGVQAIGGRRWQIFGHPQQSMQTVAAPITARPKRTYTTGVMTQKNYSQTQAGAKASFHHVTGALIVEIRGDRPFIRQLNADHEGRIYDLEYCYTGDGWEKHDGILSLTPGDEHVKFLKPGVKRATYTGKRSILKTLKPRHIIRHDILDGYARSHHHEGNHCTTYAKHVRGDDDYRVELDQIVDHLNATTPEGTQSVIVGSNHHDHLQKWLMRADDKRDPVNAKLITELRSAQYKAIDAGEDPDPFRLYVEPRLECDAVFLNRSEPFILAGVDHSQHGDVGVNGSRGSPAALARTSYKLTIGHSHTPGVEKGVYQCGVSTGQLEYQRGLSSWMNSHVVQYPNGKRTIIDIFGQQWRGGRSGG